MHRDFRNGGFEATAGGIEPAFSRLWARLTFLAGAPALLVGPHHRSAANANVTADEQD